MTDLAEEKIADAVLGHLRAWYADPSCIEYQQISRHPSNDEFSFVISWSNGNGDIAFARITVSDDALFQVQDAIDTNDGNLLDFLSARVKSFAVFYAVQQDNGGSFLWHLTAEALSERYFGVR